MHRLIAIIGLAGRAAAGVTTMNLLIADETFNNSVASVVGYDEVQNLTTVALDPITLHLGENMYYGLPKTIALTQGASTLVIHMEDREDPKEIKEPGRGPISAEANAHCHLGLSGKATCSDQGTTIRYVDGPSTIFTVYNSGKDPLTKSVGPDPCIITLTAGLEKLPVSTACAAPSQTALPSAGPSGDNTNASFSSGTECSLSRPSANATSVTITGNVGRLVTPNAAVVGGLVALVGVAAL